MRFFLFTLALIIVSAYPAQAQTNGSDEPLEVSAAGSLEWDRGAKIFTANQQARAVQGDVTIAAETLKAFYRDGAQSSTGSMEIHTLKADGGGQDVVITSNSASAYGRTLDYTVDNGRAVLRGGNLRMVSADQTVTARDNFEYFVREGRLIANGAVKVTRPKAAGGGYGAADTIEADKMIAILGNDANGKRVLRRLEAYGNVVITTPDEVLKGREGFYDASTNLAEIKDDVIITRGPNVLEGARAKVDLNTNVSTMFGGASSVQTTPDGTITRTGDGRVRGVFYPNVSKQNRQPASPSQLKAPTAFPSVPQIAPQAEQQPDVSAPVQIIPIVPEVPNEPAQPSGRLTGQ
jgi:lipopolysaccharide export system protein LptA